MSQNAIQKLRILWNNIHFARVNTTKADEEKNLLYVVYKPLNGFTKDGVPYFGHSVTTNLRPSEISKEERWKYDVYWKHYYGFTGDNIYFQRDGYCELDFTIDVTGDFSRYGNHTSGYSKRPNNGDWIAGVVVDTPRGKRFKKWFILTPEVKFLIDLIRKGETSLSRLELSAHLLTDGYPDVLWAFASLVMFDDVELFTSPLEKHPCYGQPYGRVYHNGSQSRIKWDHVYLSVSNSHFVHLMSYYFEASWWTKYKEAFDWSPPSCVGMGGVCLACEAEDRAERDVPWL